MSTTKNHLGNIQVNYTLAKGSLVILDEHHYYPFGLEHGKYNPDKREFRKAEDGGNNDIVVITEVANSGYQYKYNGKELQDELGLDWYDYGARNYDSALGRWMNIDPLSEISRRYSPYAYALDNPVYFIDPDGMKAEDWFVNKKTGALTYIKGESELNKQTADKAFGSTMSDVIFSGKDNQFDNWENLGDDEMFDTADSVVSETKSDYKSSDHAEEFAESKGYLKGIKEKIKITNFVSYDNDGEGVRETSSTRETVLDKGITYAKESNIKNKGGNVKHHYGGRVETNYEERVILPNHHKSNNYNLLIQIGKELIMLSKEILKNN